MWRKPCSLEASNINAIQSEMHAISCKLRPYAINEFAYVSFTSRSTMLSRRPVLADLGFILSGDNPSAHSVAGGYCSSAAPHRAVATQKQRSMSLRFRQEVLGMLRCPPNPATSRPSANHAIEIADRSVQKANLFERDPTGCRGAMLWTLSILSRSSRFDKVSREFPLSVLAPQS